MDLKGRIQHYLMQGYVPKQVASMCGCSTSYVSQLVNDPDFKAKLEAQMSAPVPDTEEVERVDKQYESLEQAALAGLRLNIADADIREQLAVLKEVTTIQDKRHLRKNPQLNQSSINIAVIQLPSHAVQTLAAPSVQLNTKNEVVAIGSQSLAPLSSQGVNNLFQRLKEKKDAQLVLANEI